MNSLAVPRRRSPLMRVRDFIPENSSYRGLVCEAEAGWPHFQCDSGHTSRRQFAAVEPALCFTRNAVDDNGELVNGTVSVAEIRRKLDHHEEKQRKAQISHTMRAAGGTEAAKLLRALSDPAEHHSAWQKLEQLTKLYVDLNEFGSGWLRPSEMTDDARAHLEDVANDYALQWWRYQHQPETLAHIESKLAAALKQWPDRPALPEPASRLRKNPSFDVGS